MAEYFDEELERIGLWRKLIPRDGKCLLRAIFEQLSPEFESFEQFQNRIEQGLSGQNELDDVKDLFGLIKCQEHGALEHLLFVLTNILKIQISVYQPGRRPWKFKFGPCGLRQIYLTKVAGHYDSLMTSKQAEASGFCQAILYRVLYERVFGMDRGELNRGRESINRHKSIANDSDEQSYSIPFAYRIAKSLNENIYRNMSFDNWRDYAIQNGLLNDFLPDLTGNTSMEPQFHGSSTVDEDTGPKQEHKGVSMDMMSVYDRAVQKNFMGLKQSIHHHTKPRKSMSRTFNGYQHTGALPPRYAPMRKKSIYSCPDSVSPSDSIGGSSGYCEELSDDSLRAIQTSAPVYYDYPPMNPEWQSFSPNHSRIPVQLGLPIRILNEVVPVSMVVLGILETPVQIANPIGGFLQTPSGLYCDPRIVQLNGVNHK